MLVVSCHWCWTSSYLTSIQVKTTSPPSLRNSLTMSKARCSPIRFTFDRTVQTADTVATLFLPVSKADSSVLTKHAGRGGGVRGWGGGGGCSWNGFRPVRPDGCFPCNRFRYLQQPVWRDYSCICLSLRILFLSSSWIVWALSNTPP